MADDDRGQEVPRFPTPLEIQVPALEEAYEAERRSLLTGRTAFVLKAAIVLYPAFWFLDLATAPAHALLFGGMRLGSAAIYALTLALLSTRSGPALAAPLTIFYFWVAAFWISVMASIQGGFKSDYYVGNMIVLFAIGLFLPWKLRHTITLCALILAAYVAVNAIPHGFSAAMISPLFFMGGASAFTALATIASESTRRTDYALRQKLEQANEDLRKADEAKTRFFANVSHELRTPLMLIIGPVEALKEELDDPGRRTVLEAVAANARRLLRQVNTMLEVARVEAGKLSLELAPGSIGKLLEELVLAAVPSATRRGIELRGEGLDLLPETRFDRDKVETIAANLISNALKFTPAGGRVVVRGRADETKLWFSVEDTGPGIPADEQRRLFARFFRTHEANAAGVEGTGLGLSLARELARLHGGDIRVTSEVAKGSTFEVEVLRSPEEPPERRRQYRRKEDKLAAAWLDSLVAHHHEKQRRRETLLSDVELPILASGPLPAIVTPPGASRVLLVEDNADLRTFLAHRLAARYRVETAADGILGLEAAGRVPPPDLIVSDVTMPRMDGYELCRRLRADPRLGTIPVILVTAKAGREAVIEGLDVGADDYVTKPFDLRELEARIDAHLRAKHLERRVAERDSRLAAIGRMTSAIVHDLKNPLAAIQGFAEMAVDSAESGADAATIRGDVENVLVGCGRLRTLLQELLDFAREGSLSLRAVATPVSSFTLATLGPLREELRRHGVALEVDVAVPAAVMCDLDKDRLERVIENMITNAREALAAHPPASGRPTVWVRVALESEASALSIRIADNGPGLPAELIGRLFEPFATAGKVKGTGLGLATVRNLVRAHGGDVNVEARGAEGGAAFTIRLPCPAERRSAPAGSPAPPAQRSPSDRTTGALAAGA